MVKKSSFLEKLFQRKKAENPKSSRDLGKSNDRGTDRGLARGNDRGTGARSSDRSVERSPRVVLPNRAASADAQKGAPKMGAPKAKAGNAGAPAKGKAEGQAPSKAPAKSAEGKAQAKPAVQPSKKLPPVVEERRASTPDAVARVQEAPKPVEPAPRAPQPAPSSGVSRILGGKSREDAAVALTEGFRELGSLLQGIHSRMDEQGRSSSDLNDKFVGLPDMAKAQVDFMSTVSQQLVEQREKTGELLEKLSGLPVLLDGIHKTLERTAAVEERTEKNLRDFRATMDRIHTSVGELSSQNHAAVTKATESFERTNSRTTRVFEETQKQAYDTFQKSQEQGLAQLTAIVERNGKANRGMSFMLAILAIAVVVLTVVLVQG